MVANTNKKQFLKKMGLPETSSLSINEIAQLSGMPEDALQLVYNRGYAAATTNPESVRLKFSFHKDARAPRQSKLSNEQWAYGRLYAFVNKTKKVFYGADNDIREYYNIE